MSPGQIIVLATPVFLLLIAAEFAWSVARGLRVYRFNDAINSMSLGVLSQLGALFTKVLAIGIYTVVYRSVALFPDQAFWSTWYGFVLALVFYDFCYYWLHRAGHEVAVLWAAHVVHHQSQAYNLSTALRQTSSGALLGWVFYLPMALAGVPPLVFGIVALVDLLYQFWVHTELVGKLGWFDRVFCAPSNHRVHHAVNDPYLDKNYGGILIVWDRIFGSYCEERERCVYGTRSDLRSWDPLWANAQVYWSLLEDAWHARRWRDKLKLWFKPPGWRPQDLELARPKPVFVLESVETFDPLLQRSAIWFAGLQFLLLLAGVLVVLWYADAWSTSATAIWSAALVVCYWAMGAVLQNRLPILAALLVQSAVLATATSALAMAELHAVFKPLTMLLAIALVAQSRGASTIAAGQQVLLMAALLASLVGDALLILPPRWFVPGLAAFLLAHLCYIALFRSAQPWFASRRALAATLAFGAAMLAFVWSSLGEALKPAVSAYVVVIALMAAQAIGRATRLRDGQAMAVALGACLFLLSDSLLAIDKFVTPLPLAGLWILSSYYAAQILIVLGMLRQHQAANCRS
ncbi:MAG: lysoplasmalogenase family protein [Burkholderiaceae bacterium]